MAAKAVGTPHPHIAAKAGGAEVALDDDELAELVAELDVEVIFPQKEKIGWDFQGMQHTA